MKRPRFLSPGDYIGPIHQCRRCYTPSHCLSGLVLRMHQSPALRKACVNFGERGCPPLSLLSHTAASTAAHTSIASSTIAWVTVRFTVRPLESVDVAVASSPRSGASPCRRVRSAAHDALRTPEPTFDTRHTLSTRWRSGRSARVLPLPLPHLLHVVLPHDSILAEMRWKPILWWVSCSSVCIDVPSC
jgi:hypothetical protein